MTQTAVGRRKLRMLSDRTSCRSYCDTTTLQNKAPQAVRDFKKHVGSGIPYPLQCGSARRAGHLNLERQLHSSKPMTASHAEMLIRCNVDRKGDKQKASQQGPTLRKIPRCVGSFQSCYSKLWRVPQTLQHQVPAWTTNAKLQAQLGCPESSLSLAERTAGG